MNYSLILIPIISALIGWFTNWIAIKMLFHPKEKKRFLFFEFQGVFPKRQKEIAMQLGSLVSEQLISMKEIKERINSEIDLVHIKSLVEQKMDIYLNDTFERDHPIMSLFVGDGTKQGIKQNILKQVDDMAPTAINNFLNTLESKVDIHKIVSDKVNALSPDQLEVLMNRVVNKEFKFIEILGGVLGFLIGILQVLIMYLFGS